MPCGEDGAIDHGHHKTEKGGLSIAFTVLLAHQQLILHMDSAEVHESKARSFLVQADKRLGTSGFKSWLEGGKSEKYQDAAEYYNKAATHFKQAKKRASCPFSNSICRLILLGA